MSEERNIRSGFTVPGWGSCVGPPRERSLVAPGVGSPQVVTDAEIRLHGALNALADQLSELEARLSDVLRPGLVGGGTHLAPEQNRPVRSPLAERLGTAADRVVAMEAQVQSILGRLEV